MGQYIDLTGQKFGRLTVIERVDNDKNGLTRWKCVCECGNEKITLGKLLLRGSTQSCGCYNKERVTETQMRDLTGQRFGRLTVIDRGEDYISPKGKRHVRWNCICDCGNKTVVDTNDLRRGHTMSCGCYKIDVTGEKARTHGGREDRLYHVFSNMKNRCFNKNSQDYKYYGGRGITICDDWLDYAVFKEWAYNNGYDENAPKGQCTIDRIDVNGDYCPDNCRWVPMNIQCVNKRNNKNVK